MSFKFKNWKNICEEKEAEIQRLNEGYDKILTRLKTGKEFWETQSLYSSHAYSKAEVLGNAIEMVEEEIKNVRSE